MVRLIAAALCLCPLMCSGADPANFNAAAAFGARPSVSDLSLSPDGMNVAWIAPSEGQGSVVYTLSLAKDAKPKAAFAAGGKPERVVSCGWVSNERLVCTLMFSRRDPVYGIEVLSRVIAVNTDGKNPQMLSKRDDLIYAEYAQLGGGRVIDWLPDEDGAVLMSRSYVPEIRKESRLAAKDEGLGVDRVDTRNLQTHRVEAPMRNAWDYISDGRGHVRIVATGSHSATGDNSGLYEYLYHPSGSQEWQLLSRYDSRDDSGFVPLAVDPTLNVAYGLQKLDGRDALYSISLDGSRREQLVYANPSVDVSRLIHVGRHNRVIGVSYVTEHRHAEYFVPEMQALIESLGRALPQHPALHIVDASVDESRMLVLTGSDTDPGVYYIFDRKSHQLQTFLVVRSQLEGVKLATVQPVSYAATDGTIIPAYLTLPPGKESAKGLPAIVMPHGGPSERDEWGFDWLSQFFANRGYAVLQPQFRGSAGYGEAWLPREGFHAWQLAIGDVLDAGRWLVQEKIAAPEQLAIVGWSYGGYAALQSAVVDPTLYKAVVAIAPVTDLNELKDESRFWTNHALSGEFIGSGPHMHEGSPAEHADRIKAPVLLFHAAMDDNVGIQQSRIMDQRLRAAGGKCTLVTWEELDHQLDDSAARARLLDQSDRFLQAAFAH